MLREIRSALVYQWGETVEGGWNLWIRHKEVWLLMLKRATGLRIDRHREAVGHGNVSCDLVDFVEFCERRSSLARAHQRPFISGICAYVAWAWYACQIQSGSSMGTQAVGMQYTSYTRKQDGVQIMWPVAPKFECGLHRRASYESECVRK